MVKPIAVFVTDLRGITLAKYTIVSLILSKSDIEGVFLYCDGFSPNGHQDFFDLCMQYGVKVTGKELSSESFSNFNSAKHITRTQFLKFAAVSDALETFKYALYMDIDMLVFRKLPIHDVNLGDYPMAAAYDVAECCSITNPDFEINCAQNNLSTDYFNSGLMLFDGTKFNKEKYSDTYQKIVREHQKKCDYKKGCATNDQCVYNLMFMNNWHKLGITWNVQSSMRFTEEWNHATVRHYTGPVKFLPIRPWRSDSKEAVLIKKISALLGVKNDALSFSSSLIYKLNSMRWLESINRINHAIEKIKARLAV